MRDNRGQNLVEFVILSALVIVGLILSLALLGDNVKMLLGLSTTKVEQFKPFGESYAALPDPTPDTIGEEEEEDSSVQSEEEPGDSSRGVEITYNDSGADFTVGDQDVHLSSDVMDKIGTVFQTSGADGLQSYVADTIAELIQEHANDYPANNVPVDISFGTSMRKMGNSNYEGSAAVNQVTLTVGDDIVILVNDQQLKGGYEVGAESQMGVYKIKGTKTYSNPSDAANAKFEGKIYSLAEDPTAYDINDKVVSGGCEGNGTVFNLTKSEITSLREWNLQLKDSKTSI